MPHAPNPAAPDAPALDTLACYESIGHVSRLMVAAARERDWTTLADAEHCCAALIDRLRESGGSRALDAEGRRRRTRILADVLEDDAAIRDITTPWARRVDALLAGFAANDGGGAVRR